MPTRAGIEVALEGFFDQAEKHVTNVFEVMIR